MFYLHRTSALNVADSFTKIICTREIVVASCSRVCIGIICLHYIIVIFLSASFALTHSVREPTRKMYKFLFVYFTSICTYRSFCNSIVERVPYHKVIFGFAYSTQLLVRLLTSTRTSVHKLSLYNLYR